MIYPCLILGHNYLKKIGWIRLKARQTCSWNFKPVQLLVWCQHSEYPSDKKFANPQSSMNRPDTDAQSLCYVFDSHTPIIRHHTMNPFHLDISGSWLWAACPCVIISNLPVQLKITNLLLRYNSRENPHQVPFLWIYFITALDSFFPIFQCCSYWVKC